jgi:hypothetical protein
MVTFYRPQATQAKEKPPLESYLNLTLTQHLCDEKLKPREVHACLDVEPLRAWYYRISSNSHTLVILLQIDPAFNDKPEIVCESFYETKDTYIFA